MLYERTALVVILFVHFPNEICSHEFLISYLIYLVTCQIEVNKKTEKIPAKKILKLSTIFLLLDFRKKKRRFSWQCHKKANKSDSIKCED